MIIEWIYGNVYQFQNYFTLANYVYNYSIEEADEDGTTWECYSLQETPTMEVIY